MAALLVVGGLAMATRECGDYSGATTSSGADKQ